MENREIVYTDDLFEKLDDSEKNSEFIAVESKTFLKDAWDRFKKNKIALAGCNGNSGHLCSAAISL